MNTDTLNQPSAIDVAKRRILVADDDSIILDYVEKILTGADFEVFTTTSSSEAIELAAVTDFDLAILDYRMPGLSGLEVGHAIYELTLTRFILMSRYSDRELVMQAAQDGALQFLPKPLQQAELLNTVTIGIARAAEIKAREKSLNDLKAIETSYTDAVSRGIAGARSVNTAIGILMERYRKTRSDAHAILMRLTCNERRRAVDVSEEIIVEAEAGYRRADEATNHS